MTLNVAQVCQAKYPGQVEKLNITFRQTDFDLLIDQWNVEGIARPSEADLLAEAADYEQAYALLIFMQLGTVLVQDTVDAVAQTKKYKDGVHCASYAQSTNAAWAAEAQAFVAWRDSIYAYALQQYANIQSGQPAPTEADFIAGFPEIVWP